MITNWERKNLEKGEVTLLFDHEGLSIEIQDPYSRLITAVIRIDGDNVNKAFSGLGNTPCLYKIQNEDKVGMVREYKHISFRLFSDEEENTPNFFHTLEKDKNRVKEILCELVEKEYSKDGWTFFPDRSFNSRNDIDRDEDGHWIAKAAIQRWLTKEQASEQIKNEPKILYSWPSWKIGLWHEYHDKD